MDTYQGMENFVVILIIITNKAMGFIKNPARLLVIIIRGQNSLVILANWLELKDNDKRAIKRLGMIRNASEKEKHA
jgi:hypothetical protein